MTSLTDPPIQPDHLEITGRFVDDDAGLSWYRIDGYDRLDPFLINLVTSDDQWAFVSTSGALTAGRSAATRALFPYETDDRLHRSGGLTGPVTIIAVGEDEPLMWEPFAPHQPLGRVDRWVEKTVAGDRLRFGERHRELGLTFTATWAAAGSFGLVRSCRLSADAGLAPTPVTVVDGLVDILPAGVPIALQQTASTLVDAYRRSELVEGSDLALYTVEAAITDTADPAESLLANAVWSRGLPDPVFSLTDRSLRLVRSGGALPPAGLVTGTKGAFLQSSSVTVGGDQDRSAEWVVVADSGLDHTAATALDRTLDQARPGTEAARRLVADVEEATGEAHRLLVSIVATADGLQEGADQRTTAHHFANTLFNVMRGGTFLNDHRVLTEEVGSFLADRNGPAAERFKPLAAGIDRELTIEQLRRAVAGDADLERLVDEYLPLTFSRRHGDPSRPWNTFRLPDRTPDGRLRTGYEGNWRDIFQNWETLGHSFPQYLPSFVSKFLNASTIDGHNPYRITDRGIDWEVPEEGDWANFGYWGDHQIVYLHRLLETLTAYHPDWLVDRLDRAVYSYADTPYRLRSWDSIVADSKHTLDFDEATLERVAERIERIGVDGQLVPAGDTGTGTGTGTDTDGGVRLATLAEKLIVPALAKLSNLVAGGGIWLNTQRPEWNDANNALVGNGVSVVTAMHLADYLRFVDQLLDRAGDARTVEIALDVDRWLSDIANALANALANTLTNASAAESRAVGDDGPEKRWALLNALGTAFGRYRESAYAGVGHPVDTIMVEVGDLRRRLALAHPHLETIVANADRGDGMFHTYWQLQLSECRAVLEPLNLMLEGQAAALAAADLGPKRVLALAEALESSELYRADQRSYILGPNRRPPSFLSRNRLEDAALDDAGRSLLASAAGAHLARRDLDGRWRFAPELASAREMNATLDELAAGDEHLARLVEEARPGLSAAYESVFNHGAFTGRSQSMYRYEGLGSIYWHMVSKLLLGVQQYALEALDDPQAAAGPVSGPAVDLAERYHRIRSGLGFMKSPAVQGAFPADPHSHTPAHIGAQQPGMTGQVKEGVLLRLGELGVRVAQGEVMFDPRLLPVTEFLDRPRPWSPLGAGGSLPAGSIGFTYCGVPVVYRLVDGNESTTVEITSTDGGRQVIAGRVLPGDLSAELFSRAGNPARIDVGVDRSRLFHYQAGHSAVPKER